MKLSEAGLNLIKEFEGLRLKAYPDPGTGGEPWTIGYGHTGEVQQGDVCTQEEADQYLIDDLKTACDGVCDLLTLELNDNQYSALVSFAYNCGLHNLKISTLLKEINDSNFNHITLNFEAWDHAGGHVVGGLLRRRHAEANLFLST